MPELKKLDISPSIAIILAGGLIAGAIFFTSYYPSGQITAPVDAACKVAAVSIRAPGVMVEYSDFQCPYCALIHATLKRIVDESNGEIAWVYRHFPLDSIDSQATPAALASECIAEQLGEKGFWEFAEKIFANQKSMSAAYYTQVAGELGANTTTFNACVASQKHASKIDTDAQEAFDNGGNGTPFTVVVSGGKQVPFSGALPYAQIMAVIKNVQGRQ